MAKNDRNVKDNLKKGIMLVFIANLLNLVISLVNGFILPKYLSVESYADIKTYQLYAGYIGVAVLGYSDGLYLLYGGKNFLEISRKELTVCRSNLILFQGIVTALAITSAGILHDKVLLITAISIIPVNVVATYKNIFQATGEFKVYSRILNYTSILNFIGSMILLLVIGTDNSLLYIGWMVLVTFIVWILMENKIRNQYGFRLGFSVSIQNLVENIKSGFVLMLGNFSSILMTSIDRWFVKALMSIQDFAYYSFVVSVENLINIFITPIVTTMYNYICVTKDFEKIRRIKNVCLLAALFLVSSAFPARFILEVYLTKYLASKNVLFILFSTEILYMVIKGIYVNVYKARKQQNLYFLQLVVIIVVGVVFNAAGYFLFKTNEAIAGATLLSVICWYVICSFSVKELIPTWKELLILAIALPTYIICGVFLSAVGGCIIYLTVICILAFSLMREETTFMIGYLKRMIKGKVKIGQ